MVVLLGMGAWRKAENGAVGASGVMEMLYYLVLSVGAMSVCDCQNSKD